MGEQVEQTDTYEITRDGGELTAACQCGDGLVVPDKGLGRALLATWKTRHHH